MPDPQQPVSDADLQAAQSIQSQIQHAEEAEQAHRHVIQEELQTRIFEVTQEISSHPLQVHEVHPDHGHGLQQMDGYIRGFAEPDHDHATLMAHHDEPVVESHDVVAHAEPAAGTDTGHDAA
jgi:hypothetical protein